MTKIELENSTQDGLSRVAHISEGTSLAIYALTGLSAGLVTAFEISKHRLPRNGIFTVGLGVSVAVAAKSLSALCDLGVAAINRKNGLA